MGVISDDQLRKRLLQVNGRGNSDPVTRGNPPESARRGELEFDELLEELEESYVDSEYPGLTSYAYRADQISIEEARDVMDEILDDVVEIRWPDDAHPEFRLKGEDKWRSVTDSEDFPQPSTDEAEESDDEEEDEEGEEEDGECYEDCPCPDGCECGVCGCGSGKRCCCECSVNAEDSA